MEIYPLVMTNIAIEHGPVEIVDPYNMVIFHSFVYVETRGSHWAQNWGLDVQNEEFDQV